MMTRKISCLAVVLISILLVYANAEEQQKKTAPSEKCIKTFMVKLRGGEKIDSSAVNKIAKFDMLVITRNWYDAVNHDTWSAIKDINPDCEIFIQVEGPTIYRKHDFEDIRFCKGIARYSNPRGHSMGNLNDDHPEFFLLDKNGNRCWAYRNTGYKERYLMDIGNPSYQDYWVEAILTDVVNGPFRADGLHIDNVGPVNTFNSDDPIKYDTPEKWKNAANSFVDKITKKMHENNTKIWINAGGTHSEKGCVMLMTLDGLENPPDVVGEEGAFVHSWGKADATFEREDQWRSSLDFMSRLKKSSQAYFAHVKIDPGESGIDNWGKPFTFRQALWYALGSYLLGNDGNDYFFFSGKSRYGKKDWWFNEYSSIDLGKPAGPYQVNLHDGNNIYYREFANGYVYVNPTSNDAKGINLRGKCRQLSAENLNKKRSGISLTKKIDVPSHRAVILLKDKKL
ncbi:hypothetical protein JXQ31_02140 [candidate division KSB1 bacterium]|nr:hypothetical protein [candidate division KSB1 bacterium]